MPKQVHIINAVRPGDHRRHQARHLQVHVHPAPVSDGHMLTGQHGKAGGELAAIAENVCDFTARAGGAAPSRKVQAQVIQEALARVQATRSTWTRSGVDGYGAA